MKKENDYEVEYRIFNIAENEKGAAFFRRVPDEEYWQYYQNDLRIVNHSGTYWLMLFPLDSLAGKHNIVSVLKDAIPDCKNMSIY